MLRTRDPVSVVAMDLYLQCDYSIHRIFLTFLLLAQKKSKQNLPAVTVGWCAAGREKGKLNLRDVRMPERTRPHERRCVLMRVRVNMLPYLAPGRARV
jgi:hypothetical protein